MPEAFTRSLYPPKAQLRRWLRARNCVYEYFAADGFQNRCQRSLYASTFARTAIKTDRSRTGGGIIALPSAGWPPSGRIDPAYSNIILQSQTFDNASWSKTRMNATTPVVADDTTAPDGTVTADRLVEDSTAASNHSILQSPTVSSGINYTASLFIKYSGTRGWCRFGFTNAAFGAVAIYVNIQTGATGTVVGSPVAYRVEEWPNGWFRIIITAASTGTVGGYQLFTATADNTISYNGDNASGFYVWGAMMETGSIAHPYYPTTTIAAGPDADVFTANVELSTGFGSERTYAIMYEQDYPHASYVSGTGFFLHHLKVAPQDSVQLTTNATQIIMNLRDESSIVTQLVLSRASALAAGRHVIVISLMQSNSFMLSDGIIHDSTTSNGNFTSDGSNNKIYIGASLTSAGERGVRIRSMLILDRAISKIDGALLTDLLFRANP